MTDSVELIHALEARKMRREGRRAFFQAAVGAAAGAAAIGATGFGFASAADAQAVTDADVLNFALNLEYLEANYYISAAFGSQLNSTYQSGTGTQGAVTGGRQVTFADKTIAAYAREIAADELAHVAFLRSQLGSSAVAMPAINIDGGTSGAFTAAARAAGVVGASGTFDPYASDDNWLLGGMLLTDVGVTAYKGSASLIASKTILEAAAGILAVEAYHSGLLRTSLYRRGLNTSTDRTYADKISDARDSLDGSSDDDQGISPTTINGGTASNIVPADSDGIVYGRTAANVLNVVYLTKSSATAGGFFPAGLNGNIKASNAN